MGESDKRDGWDLDKSRREDWSTVHRGRMHAGLLAAAALVLLIGGCGPPQVLDNEECFSTVDALWTAVTARRPDLLELTADDLARLRDVGNLSDEGYATLEKIIDQARAGEWEPAAKRLKSFIQGQRRPSERVN